MKKREKMLSIRKKNQREERLENSKNSDKGCESIG